MTTKQLIIVKQYCSKPKNIVKSTSNLCSYYKYIIYEIIYLEFYSFFINN